MTVQTNTPLNRPDGFRATIGTGPNGLNGSKPPISHIGLTWNNLLKLHS
jgi:hypothetical protein